MNAIKLYVSTARLILQNDQYDYSVCKEINNTLPNLEQSLTCTVCRNLLTEPFSPTETTCQHHVCKACIGGRKKLRPSCSWCKDYTKYVKNTQLQCLLACYKGLCQYIKCTNLFTQLTDLNSLIDNDRNVLNIIEKGIEIPNHHKDIKLKMEFSKMNENTNLASMTNDVDDTKYRPFERHISSGVQENHVFENNILTGVSQNESCFIDVSRIKVEQSSPERCTSSVSSRERLLDPINTETHSLRLRSADDTRRLYSVDTSEFNDSFVTENVDPKPLYSVTFAGTRSKLILKRRSVTPRRDTNPDQSYIVKHSTNVEQLPISYSLRTPDYHSQSQEYVPTFDSTRHRKTKSKPVNNLDRPNCRCGNATPRPGKLTCCGQRCACYMQSKACAGCRCRGCRNPHMIDGVKVLGRFMKEDQNNQNVVLTNSSCFPDLSANFLNQQINQVLPDMSGSTVINIS